MFNLQQRPNNVSSLFQPVNNPSLQSSAQSFIQKQEHNSDSSSKNSEKEDSPSKNKLFNNIPKSEGKLKKKDSNINNLNAQLLNGNNSSGLTSQQLNMLQQQLNCNLPSNNNGLNQLNNMNISSLQQQSQQNSVNQNFPSFDISSLQTEEQTKQLLLTKMMINQLLLSNNSMPQQNMQLQNQQQQQYQTLLQQQQLIQSLQQAQTSNMLNQNNYIPTPQPVPTAAAQLIQSTPVPASVVTPQLSNRYSSISMNANDKVLTTENDDSDDENDKFKSQLKKSIRKRQKKMNNCGHPDREHYAKGMCSNCYHKYGRTKKPWLCPHEKLYACGLCQNCYINKYNQRKRTENDGPMDGSEKIESDDQNINFSEIDQPEQNNQLTDTERPQKTLKKQLEAQQNQQQQSQIQHRQAQQDQAAYGDDEDQGEDEDEEDDGQ